MYMLSSGEGTSRCLWLGGNGAASPMVKRACKCDLLDEEA
jgi:hypothetical protein